MTINESISKKDWKLFQEKIGKWQERYMERLSEEYIQLLSSDKCASEKFWELDKRIKQDKKKPGVLIRLSKSEMFFNLNMLLNDEAITLEDLNEFSEELQENIKEFRERFCK